MWCEGLGSEEETAFGLSGQGCKPSGPPNPAGCGENHRKPSMTRHKEASETPAMMSTWTIGCMEQPPGLGQHDPGGRSVQPDLLPKYQRPGTAPGAGRAAISSCWANSRVWAKGGLGGMYWGGCSRYIAEGNVMPPTWVWHPDMAGAATAKPNPSHMIAFRAMAHLGKSSAPACTGSESLENIGDADDSA